MTTSGSLARVRSALAGLLLVAGMGAMGCDQSAYCPTTGPLQTARLPSVTVHESAPAVVPIHRVAPVRPAALAVRTIDLGKTAKGRALKAYVLGKGPVSMLIMGGIHGDEPAGAAVVQKLLDELRARPDLLDGQAVAIYPRANPDGLAAGTRTNSAGVDCNRNFPARNWARAAAKQRYNGGAKPASEPETRAIIRLVEDLKPKAIISLHAISGGRECNNWDGPGEPLARMLEARNHLPAKGSIGYPTPGSMGTWAGVEGRCPMVTLELPSGKNNDRCWAMVRASLLAAVRYQAGADGSLAESPQHGGPSPAATDTSVGGR